MWETDLRPSRDEVGLMNAYAWSFRGTCGRRQVGCILVDDQGVVLSTGYNGPARGEPHCRDTGGGLDRACAGRHLPSGTGLERCEAIHAEQNALIDCRQPDRIHTAYVTSAPCLHCVKMLMNTPCRRIVFAEAYPHMEQACALWLANPGAARHWVHLSLPEKWRKWP